MTDQPIEHTEHFDEVDQLNWQLERLQVKEAQELAEAQQEFGKFLDKNIYNNKRKQISDLYSEASKVLINTIGETKETTRKNLALSLHFEGNTETDRAAWNRAVDLVENAGNDINKIEPLIHRAVMYKDQALARVLTMKHCGTPDRKKMHEVLAKVDDRVAATFAYESRHGAYKKPTGASGDQAWPGWVSYKEGDPIDIPGRKKELQPSYLREQKRKAMEQMHAGNK